MVNRKRSGESAAAPRSCDRLPRRLRFRRGVVIASLVVLLVPAGVASSQSPRPAPAAAVARGNDAAIAEVAAASRAYLDALERGDGAALSALWTADGDIVDEFGTVRNGRESVADVKPDDGTDRALAVGVSNVTIRLVAPSVAIEDGTVEVASTTGGAVRRGRFTATWVRQDDGWKLAGVRENHFEGGDELEEMSRLDWMVGDWDVFDTVAAEKDTNNANAPPQPRLHVTVRWSPARAFLIRELRTEENDGETLVITQYIGWDPASRQIRSWTFGEDGGHGEGVWNWEDDAWFARTSTVLPDGARTTSVNVYRFDGDDSCSWQSLSTDVATQNTAPVTAIMVKRKPTR